MFKFNNNFISKRINKSKRGKNKRSKSSTNIVSVTSPSDGTVTTNTVITNTNTTTLQPFSPLSPFSPLTPINLKQSETSETTVLYAAKSKSNPPTPLPIARATPQDNAYHKYGATIYEIKEENNDKQVVNNPTTTIATATQQHTQQHSNDHLSIIEPSKLFNRQQTPSTITPISVIADPCDCDCDEQQTDNDDNDDNVQIMTITDGVHFGVNDLDLDIDLSVSRSRSFEGSDCNLPTPSSEDCESPELPDNLTMTQLLLNLTEVDEDLTLAQHGYKRIRKICDTLQGELIEAEVTINSSSNRNKESAISSNGININEQKENVQPKQIERVAIKRTDKALFKERIAESDGMTFCVEENIVKEALILHHLTIDNRSTANYCVRFVEFFESDEHFYLVMEYIEGDYNLKEFATKAHEYINNGKLKIKEYQKIIKYIFWQLSAVLYWLHNDMHCCHLDMCLENVMLQNADFIVSEDGNTVTINPAISAKLVDFGRSELFKATGKPSDFECQKFCMSLDSVQYLSPKLYVEETYDAKSADLWALGMMLYHCCIGEPLYVMIEESSEDEEDDEDIINDFGYSNNKNKGSGYWAVQNGQLKKYLQMNNLTKYVNARILDLITNLLKIKESDRFNISKVLKHQWFKSYFQKYKQRIERKSESQKLRLSEQKQKLDIFPFYNVTRNSSTNSF